MSLSSDFIAGFCGETEEEHHDTITLLETVKFDMAYMFAYSMRKVNNVYYTHMLIKNIKYEKCLYSHLIHFNVYENDCVCDIVEPNYLFIHSPSHTHTHTRTHTHTIENSCLSQDER